MPGKLRPRVGSIRKVLKSYLTDSQGERYNKIVMLMTIMTMTLRIMTIKIMTIKIIINLTAIIRSFEFDPDTSCTGCSKDTKVTILNLGLQVT